MKQEAVFEMIDKHDIISFDVFDTLVVRNVLKPVDIFALVEVRYNSKHLDNQIHNFLNIRYEAEKLARLGKKTEVSIEEIYNHIDLNREVKNDLMELEMETEFDYIETNQALFPLYAYSREKRKTIVISSDMYLPEDFIKKVLLNCGIDGFDRLFVSSTLGHRKKTGALFEHICKEYQCNPKKVLHIGDNKISDFKMAKRCGLKAYLVKKDESNLYHFVKAKFRFGPIQNNIAAAIVNNYSGMNPPCQKLGHQVLGLPLVGFCQWIHKNTTGTKKFFLARDGYLIKKAYEILYPEERNDCHYLYLSRKSLRMPNIYAGIEFRHIVEQFPNLKEYSIHVFCELIGLDKEKQAKYIQRFGDISPVKSRSELGNSNEYSFIFDTIKDEESLYLKERHDALLKYLEKEGFFGKVAVIDVGWRATAQINLERLIGDSAQITGYYFGVEKSMSNQNVQRESINGYFWDWNGCNNIGKSLLNGRKGLFEVMFLSNQGSTISYLMKDGSVRPLLETTSNDQLRAREIQDGALDFVRSFGKYQRQLPSFSSDDTAAPLGDFIRYPCIPDMEIGDLICENYRMAYLAKPRRIKDYIKNPRSLINDFARSEWKVGFVSRLIKPSRTIQALLNTAYDSLKKR